MKINIILPIISLEYLKLNVKFVKLNTSSLMFALLVFWVGAGSVPCSLAFCSFVGFHNEISAIKKKRKKSSDYICEVYMLINV